MSESKSTKATTYEELVEVLGADADILQYLPSASEVDQLFEEYERAYKPKRSKHRSSISRLFFGMYQEDEATMSQVYVYLRSPSFDNKEPSMTFVGLTAKMKLTMMSVEDIKKSYGALQVHEFWRPLVSENGKIHFQALRGVLKVFFVRKGITLSVPIPVPDLDLIQGCQMFKDYANKSKHETRKSAPRQLSTSESLADTLGMNASSLILTQDHSVTDPVSITYVKSSLLICSNFMKLMYTTETISGHDTSCVTSLEPPLITTSTEQQHHSPQMSIKTEHDASSAACENHASETSNPDAVVSPRLRPEGVTGPSASQPLVCFHTELYKHELLYTDLLQTPQCDKIRNIVQSLSASRKHRSILSSTIQQKAGEKVQKLAELKELQLEEEDFEATIQRVKEDIKRRRAAITEKISAKKREITDTDAQIEADTLAVSERLKSEKRQLSEMDPDIAGFWHLAVQFAHDELHGNGEPTAKRQKTSSEVSGEIPI